LPASGRLGYSRVKEVPELKTTTSTRLAAALCLCLAGAAVSFLLLLQHHGEGRAVVTVNQVCGDGETSGCETVARSPWSSIRGVPLAAFGVAFYLSLALLLGLTLLAPEEQRHALAGVVVAGLALGLLVDLLLLGVQAFAVRAYCTLCILTYVLSAVALFALLPAWTGARGLRSALAKAEGRLVVAGWVLGTLAVASAVLGAEVALDERETRHHLAMLGTPAPARPADPAAPEATAEPTPAAPPAAAPEPTPASQPEGQAPASMADATGVDWEKRARELQATLDDPQKLEEYFSKKARHEFETAKVEKIDLHDAAFRGPQDAPVKVVEFSDFLCPFCRNLALGLAQFIPQAGGRVVVYFKNFPLDQTCNPRLRATTHPGACWLALGAVCAHLQGRFEAYHDRVFSAEGLHNPDAADVVRLAGEAGLNAQAIEGCIRDPETKKILERQIDEAYELGIHATPTIFIDGKKLPRINDFVAVVDTEAQKKGFPALHN